MIKIMEMQFGQFGLGSRFNPPPPNEVYWRILGQLLSFISFAGLLLGYNMEARTTHCLEFLGKRAGQNYKGTKMGGEIL